MGPVTGVTSSAARAFAEWLSQRDRRHYRLPTLDEMCDIAYQTCQELSLWPCRSWDRHQVWRQAQDCHSEWLDCSPTVADGNNSMNCITHPAWLLNNYATITHGALADSGHSFITFRLVRSGAK